MKKTSIYAKRQVDRGSGYVFQYAKINAYGCNPYLPEGYELADDQQDWAIDHEINQIGIDDLGTAIEALQQVEKLYQERINEAGFLRNEINNMRGAISAHLNELGKTRVVVNGHYVGRSDENASFIVIEPIEVI